MKKSPVVVALMSSLLLACGSPLAFAGTQAKEVTLKGEAMCAKCELGETDKCQTVLEVTEDGKTEKYYVAANPVGKKFHQEICQAPAKATATGTVKSEDGKMILTPSKMELAE